MTWEFSMVIGMFIGMMAAIFILDGFGPTYEHVSLARGEQGIGELITGGYTREECDEQVRRGEFLDNNLHYCRPVR